MGHIAFVTRVKGITLFGILEESDSFREIVYVHQL
jgi:hypothetical protein